jgi:hypothetical protein
MSETCSHCGGRVVEITYGMPSPAMVEGESIYIGGCDMMLDPQGGANPCHGCLGAGPSGASKA